MRDKGVSPGEGRSPDSPSPRPWLQSPYPVALGLAQPAGHDHGLGALFGGHSPADCQLLDQLHYGGAAVAESSLPLAPPDGQRVASPAAQPLRAAPPLPFQARAPPLA